MTTKEERAAWRKELLVSIEKAEQFGPAAAYFAAPIANGNRRVVDLIDELDAREAELAAAWTDGMGVGYKAGTEPLWIPPENPYRKEPR